VIAEQTVDTEERFGLRIITFVTQVYGLQPLSARLASGARGRAGTELAPELHPRQRLSAQRSSRHPLPSCLDQPLARVTTQEHEPARLVELGPQHSQPPTILMRITDLKTRHRNYLL
jgi:hypothetical protein